MDSLRTDRLILRPARTDDANELHAIFGQPEAMRYWSTLPHTSLQQTVAWLDSMIAIPAAEGEDFIVEYGGRVIGKAGFYRFPEIGFILSSDYWGKGLASEALAAVIARAFAVHKLPRIIADVDPRNAASLALLTKLGFVQTGYRERTFNLAGEWCDSVDLALENSALAVAHNANVP